MMTKWPNRLMCDGPRSTRNNSPLRRYLSSPELTAGRLTGIGSSICHAVDDLDLVAVGIGQAHALAAAGLVDVFDRRGAVDPRDLLEILHARGVNGDPDIARLAQFGDVDVVRRIGAAHVERVLGPVGADHAEIGQELLLLVEIGRAQPPISEIEGFDHRHENLPKRTYQASLRTFRSRTGTRE